jgi:hypothetical protein
MQFHTAARPKTIATKNVLAMAAAAVPLLSVAFVSGQTYSTTPTPVFTAVSAGFTSVTDGINSTTNVAPLIEGDSSVIAGYATVSGFRQIYYLSPMAPFPNTATTFSLTDSGHAQSSTTPSLVDVSSGGVVLGTQSRVDASGNTTTPLGTDVFTYNGSGSPVIVPLPTTVLGGGASYSYNNSSISPVQASYTMGVSTGTDSTSGLSTNPIGPTGIVAGTVQRYAGNSYSSPSTILGDDAFYYNPGTGTSIAIGLTGAGYSYTPSTVTNPSLLSQASSVTGTAGASVAGYSARYNSSGGALGNDSWLYNPTNTSSGAVQIGLVGGAYTVTIGSSTYQQNETVRTNSLGQVLGKVWQPNPTTGAILGTTNYLYLYTPSSTPGTATGFGTTSAGTYTQVGLTGAPTATAFGYSNPTSTTFTSNNNPAFLNNQGHAAGTTNRYDIGGNYEGGAAWYYNGTTNVDISPVDSIHQVASYSTTYSSVYSSNTVTAVNNKGLVAAYATRVAGTTTGSAALGQDAYVYDSNTGHEYFVDPTDESMGTGNYEYSYVGIIGDNGVAVGYYNTYSGTSSTVLSSTLFDWTEGGGLQTLATYSGSAASSSMAAYVDSFEFGPDGTLYGPNTYGSAATSIVAYTVVPEPSALGLMAIGTIGLLRRRRRIE